MQPNVTLKAEYGGQTLEWIGKIVRAEAEIDTASRMVQLVARIRSDEITEELSVGLFVTAEISGLPSITSCGYRVRPYATTTKCW